MNPVAVPGQYATPPTWFPVLPPNRPPSSAFWDSTSVHDWLRELQETLSIARAMQKELEMLVLIKDNEDVKSRSADASVHQFLKHIEDCNFDIGFQESCSVQAANALISKLREQLEPFRVVTDENSPWEEKSAAFRLRNRVNKSKRNKLWRKRKRIRVAERVEQERQRFDQADKEADEWRAREIAMDISRRKVEKMKEIAKMKAKEEKKRLESELELVLIVEKLQELRSIRIQKLKKLGHFIPEEDDEFLERVRAAVEEEERLAAAKAHIDAAKDAIASAEVSRKPTQSSEPETKDLNDNKPGNLETRDQTTEAEVVTSTETSTACDVNQVSDGNACGGTYDSVANLPAEFYHYYHGSNHDMSTLIEVRRTWDAYIRPGGSRIPGHWVQPPPPADEVWASYLVKPK
ncbi:U11/U12 small nuclear ribonucleoprotein 59 kDa protein [Punica granatum]|uniref:U11/U12 small nuclear ribonucleoprotein 59 kDa protein n=2 Tax=Punica granatum TaxID=22663 RepID=A0A6P8BU31_PUNGR|nr:U11/U12 small nuclear ribonucleoprotein 59 kDa protein [Punica granatum]XP_031373720.1 U11/U12 small nuclear ribonucleoprotein 59 kDa protein [Punica granatum]XP_031373728.1 U11/U12 small nuclear ribonucleoprotein 59 kDa protein [Punica granatum]XP_031373738.1 U11/U12 small nuclear ribonucleoprotein 59 kDa protein [Punica granatum]PKI46341.1 hypothetical protein CRG98_033236 [Punica granatum]